MKKVNRARGAISLCAVMVVLALLLCHAPSIPASAEEETTAAGQKNYRYAVTIEFGSMTFYYDYGRWDVNEMCYKAGTSSQNPAAGTVQGYPGWYGFDGIANRIGVQFTDSENNAQARLSVTLGYGVIDSSVDTTDAMSNISMDFYIDQNLTEKLENNTFSVSPSGTKTEIFASLRGEPGFYSETFAPIGFLSITIGKITG